MRQVAALNQFISRSTDQFFQFFKALQNAMNGMCEKAFHPLKQFLMNPHLLCQIMNREMPCNLSKNCESGTCSRGKSERKKEQCTLQAES